MKHLSKNTLLAIGGVAFVVAVCSFLVFQSAREHADSAVHGITDPFQRGQYYFNYENSPDGPYDLEKARHYYEEAIRASSTQYAFAWYQLGRIDFLEGEFNAAIYNFNKQVEHFGDATPSVYYLLGLTYGYKASERDNARDWAKAEQGFLDYLAYDPESPWARTDLAWVYFAQGKYEEMLPVLEKGLEIHPEHPWLLNMYGLAFLNLGAYEKAHRTLLEAQTFAAEVTVEDWGQAYPGNDPARWHEGLAEFNYLIQKNIDIAESKL